MSLHQRAVVTYDFESLSIHLYDGQAHSTIPLTPQQAILLSHELLTNALLCQSHERAQVRQPDTSASSSVSTVTTSPSQTAVISEETAVPVEPLASARSA